MGVSVVTIAFSIELSVGPGADPSGNGSGGREETSCFGPSLSIKCSFNDGQGVVEIEGKVSRMSCKFGSYEKINNI